MALVLVVIGCITGCIAFLLSTGISVPVNQLVEVVRALNRMDFSQQVCACLNPECHIYALSTLDIRSLNYRCFSGTREIKHETKFIEPLQSACSRQLSNVSACVGDCVAIVSPNITDTEASVSRKPGGDPHDLYPEEHKSLHK